MITAVPMNTLETHAHNGLLIALFLLHFDCRQEVLQPVPRVRIPPSPLLSPTRSRCRWAYSDGLDGLPAWRVRQRSIRYLTLWAEAIAKKVDRGCWFSRERQDRARDGFGADDYRKIAKSETINQSSLTLIRPDGGTSPRL